MNTLHEPKSTTVLELKYRSYEMFTIIQEFTEKYRGFRGSLFSIHPLSGCERLRGTIGILCDTDALVIIADCVIPELYITGTNGSECRAIQGTDDQVVSNNAIGAFPFIIQPRSIIVHANIIYNIYGIALDIAPCTPAIIGVEEIVGNRCSRARA